MTKNRINLYSDTQTRPTPAMREAMAHAEVGDEQRMEDPTVNRLCERAADFLGKEAAVFLPSGTMCNEIALLVHCRPGDEVIAAKQCHILNFEGGAPAALAGVQIAPVETADGTFGAAAVRAHYRPPNRYSPRSRLVSVEQTVNMTGGVVWPLPLLEDVGAAARECGLAMHMDGARLANAAVAAGIAARDFAAPCDSVWLDLTKGLGCPVGAVLAGSRAFIEEAWYWKQRIGGAMRQAGIIAAAGLYALDNHVDRLEEDHDNAQLLADLLREVPGLTVEDETIATNMVFFRVADGRLDAGDLAARLVDEGVVVSVSGPRRLRAVTHLDVDKDGVRAAADALRRIMANL